MQTRRRQKHETNTISGPYDSEMPWHTSQPFPRLRVLFTLPTMPDNTRSQSRISSRPSPCSYCSLMTATEGQQNDTHTHTRFTHLTLHKTKRQHCHSQEISTESQHPTPFGFFSIISSCRCISTALKRKRENMLIAFYASNVNIISHLRFLDTIRTTYRQGFGWSNPSVDELCCLVQ